nr:protein FAR1-RELATED SEQUENCE 1-like [Aegilops tauschii subsp. strangulata]
MKKYKDHLALLYKAHEKLKDDLNAVLNHPLMPSEFERAWKDLIQRYNLQDDELINSLWEDRHEWISAYYKEVFCARMTSTQRSESMNLILKQNFVKEKHDLHLFAQQVDKCIQTRKAVEHAETVANDSEVKTTTLFGFEVQLSKVYTRTVFADFKETLYRTTAFRAERCPENPTKYLVHHYNRSYAFDGARHNFQVVADEQKGVYECECKLWTHTENDATFKKQGRNTKGCSSHRWKSKATINKQAGSKEGCSSQQPKTKAAINQHEGIKEGCSSQHRKMKAAINQHAGSKEGCSSHHSKTKATINQNARDYKHNGAETGTSNTTMENKRKCDIRHAPVTAERSSRLTTK